MKPIPGYETYYSAEEDGRIFSHTTNKYLTENTSRRYLKFTLCKDGVRKDIDVHRLIALTFIPNPDNKPYIDHIDKNKHNNTVNNLRWVSPQENSANLPIFSNNKLGQQNICIHRHIRGDNVYLYFKVEFVRGGVVSSKSFKTLEKAVKYRDDYLLTK